MSRHKTMYLKPFSAEVKSQPMMLKFIAKIFGEMLLLFQNTLCLGVLLIS